MARVSRADTSAAPVPARAGQRQARWQLSPRHIRALLWLRVMLTLHGFSASPAQLIGFIISLLVLLPLSLGGAYGVALGFQLLSPAWRVQLLFGVLGALYIAWAALPLLQYALNEGLDITKLQAYPLSRVEQMLSLVLATLFDPSTLVLLALYSAIAMSWHASVIAAIITVVALVVAYAHTVALSQLTLSALVGMLRSRRYRDLSIVVVAVAVSLCSIGSQVVFHSFGGVSLAGVAGLRLDTYLRWIPPGMAARAIQRASAGDIPHALAWLAALVILFPLLLALWARLIEHNLVTTEGAAGARRGRAHHTTRVVAGGATPVAGTMHRPARGGLLPGPARAIAAKEVRYMWRDPQIKAAILSSMVYVLFIILPQLYAPGRQVAGGARPLGGIEIFIAPLPALLITLSLARNALGMERQGLQQLLLFPVRPVDIFWGKNLAVGTLAFAVQVALTCGTAALTGSWGGDVWLTLAVGLAAILVMLGCGNVSSVLAPFRMRQMRTGSGTVSGQSGCLQALLGLLVLASTWALLMPVVAAVGIPLLLGHQVWLSISVPLALLYGVGLHQLATRLIAPRVLARAPELLHVIVAEE